MNESELIGAIATLIKPTERLNIRFGIGDDAAVWQPSRSHRSVISSDMLVEGVHFLQAQASAEAIGWKALAVNLSDLAAMGARPVLATVALGLPAPLDAPWVLELYRGIVSLAKKARLAIVGGDISRAPVVTISITVVGEVRASRVALRNGAQIKDILAVTGPLGASRAGRALSAKPRAEYADSPSSLALIERHLRPQARIAEGQFLASTRALHAMMDLSDGLAADLPKLVAASGCGALIDEIPVAEGVEAVAESAAVDPLYWALNGGEDYELLIAVAPRNYESLARSFRFRFGRDLRSIGYCTEEQGVRISTPAGIVAMDAIGWDHFAAEEERSPNVDGAGDPSGADAAAINLQLDPRSSPATTAAPDLPSAELPITSAPAGHEVPPEPIVLATSDPLTEMPTLPTGEYVLPDFLPAEFVPPAELSAPDVHEIAQQPANVKEFDLSAESEANSFD